MPRYTDESKERVRDAIDMIDLVGSRVELRRSGGTSFTGLCPFHEERSPSFSVDAAKKLYHCFGCGEGGDGIKFVQQLEGLDFVGALEYLADRYKVPLEVLEEDAGAAQRRERRERLLELLERAATFYARTLWESAEAAPAREYLASRGLEEATLREFRVGYAPSAWDKMLLASRRAGFENREIYDAGLAQRGKQSNQIFDRFRRRIMFPLADRRGRVLGFGARALGADQKPKYLNTSENEVFHKGRQLFGSDVARAAAAKAGSVIVAEGYTDVLALHQAGLRNAVGIMGTAMTPEQVEALSGLAPTVVLALDADGAGQEAMLRAARVAAGRKLELRVVPLPVGADPADLVQSEGPQAVTERIEASVPFVRFRVERALATADLSGAEGKDQVIDELRPVFSQLPPSVMRQELQHMVAERLDLHEELVAQLLGQAPTVRPAAASTPSSTANDAPSPARPVSRSERIERTFLALCIALPGPGAEALARVGDDHFGSALQLRAAVHLRAHLASPAEGIDESDEELSRLITELSVRAGRGTATKQLLRAEELQLELARIDRLIVAARGPDAPPNVSVADLARERATVKADLDAAMDSAMEASAEAR
ncbi:MAG TPA: DNA primase [Solirubrobacteraceae bacterium]|nr:DNA primase [Solirubrobacteraceae bacterium]